LAISNKIVEAQNRVTRTISRDLLKLFSHIFRFAERWLITKPTKKIFAHIKQHPGIRYRQLLRLTGLANGVMSFHLKKLNKSKLTKAKKLGYNIIRYYPITVKTTETDILDHLLNSARRKIIFLLLE
jgi:predicted transcriptional regulator